MKKPQGFEQYLADFKAISYDGYSGEPVAWGFKIKRHLGDELFSKLKKYGDLAVISREYGSVWGLIIKRLTLDEAIEKYGPIKKILTGPRGGNRTIEFRDKKFYTENIDCDRDLLPKHLIEVEQ